MGSKIATSVIVAILVLSLMAGVQGRDENRVDIELELQDLTPLETGHYEGWLIVDGSPASTGKFQVTAGGMIVDLDGEEIAKFRVKDVDLADASAFVVSIEPEGDTNPAPAAIKPLAGNLNAAKDTAVLGPNLGVDLTSAGGVYILATPSNNFPTGDYDLDLDFDNLPTLGSGHYEGWLIVDGSPVSTGKFNVDASGDLVDLQGNAIDTFLVEGLEVDDVSRFVLTVEPEGDDDDVPAAPKPLSGAVDGTGMGGMISVDVELDDIGGEYILATPSNNDDYFLDLTFDGLATLASGHYEGWLVVGGSPVSTGKFNVDGSGNLVDLQDDVIDMFLVEDLDAAMVSAFVLTIEEEGDDDAVPGAIKPLAGAVDGTGMAGDIAHNVGVDLSGVAGEYILATPSNGADTDELSGIWYLNRSTGTPVAGLDLPDLTGTDWVYEGWVVIGGVPVTSGRFNMSSGADGFDGYSASDMYPPFPGEDFLANAPAGVTFPTDLSGQTAVISVEPRVDPDPAPFQFKPLLGMVPSDATDHLEYQLDNAADTLPTGTFALSVAPTDELSGIWYLNRSTGTPVAGLDLPDLSGTDWVYEGWVVIDGEPVTSGTFLMPDGTDAFDGYSASDMYPPFPGEDFLENAPNGVTFPTDLSGQTAVISIEPADDPDPAPFILKPLVGTIPSEATDHMEYPLEDMSAMMPSGTFALEERAPPPSEENSGIWFLDPSGAEVVAGLDLPDLSGTDWQYEGWVVIDGVPVTTGKFDRPAGTDDFDGYSASDMYPPFPGEDFLTNAPDGVTFPTDLAGQKAVISIEPRMDDDPAPFQFKPLVGDVPTGAQDHVVYDLTDSISSLPEGSVSLTEVAMDGDDDGDNTLVYAAIVIVLLIVVAAIVAASTRGRSE